MPKSFKDFYGKTSYNLLNETNVQNVWSCDLVHEEPFDYQCAQLLDKKYMSVVEKTKILKQKKNIEGSSYKASVDEEGDNDVSMGSSTTLILIIACSLLAVVVIVILGVYCKNKKQKTLITDTYEVKESKFFV